MAREESELLNSFETDTHTPRPSTDFLTGGGEMGERIRAKDWSGTPLGPVESWPQSLKTVVRIMLTSRQPIWIGWGPELIKLYNDPYKAIVGGKHPEALGQPARVVWREIWDDLEPRLQTAYQNNEGTYDESLLLIMERYGYQEETYYTFSYSPVPGDKGGVGGIICANTDDTQRIIGERQVTLLRTLAAETADARTIEDACRLSASSLQQDAHDLPFAMLYLIDHEKQEVSLAGTTGIARGHEAVPERVALDAHTFWPFADVVKHQKVCVTSNLNQTFDALPMGAWNRSPHEAAVLPIAPSGNTGQAGVLIVGLNPFRRFDEGYQGFLDLVSGQIAASIGNAQAYEEERKRAEALAEIDRAKTLFFSNVSHEFRTPLTLMLGPIEDTLAERETLSREQRERTEILHRNALRLLKLVNALLDFSRIEAGRVQAVYEPTDLATLTTDLASSFRSAIEKAGMTLIVDCPTLDSVVYVDHEMWEKIVLNLLSNAFKYTLEGSITVSLCQKGSMVELSVKDTGVGIPEEELPHMFERFHRVVGTKGRTYEGTGIGLSLVQELVKLHGGTVNVASTPGKGSTFTVSLPPGITHLPTDRITAERTLPSTALNTQVYADEALRLLPGQEDAFDVLPDEARSHDGKYQSQTEKQHIAGERTHLPRILFADDNADMREYVSRLLQSRYDVQTVSNGRAALDAVKMHRPDMVLTDVMMPEMDGFELLQALRTNSQTKTLPVILLSARAGEEANIEGMKAGADDYLVKPFNARELLARVGAHLEMARLRSEQVDAMKRAEETEVRLHTIINNVPLVIWSLDAQGIYTLSEGKGLEALGIQPGELVGKSQFELYKDLPELVAPVLQALDGQTIIEVAEFRGRWYETIYSPLRDEHGTITGIVAVSTDITGRKHAEEEARASEERFRLLADNIAQFAWMADENGWIFWYNQRWYDYTGTTLEEMQGWGWQKVHHPDHVARVVEKVSRHFQTGVVWEDTFPLRGKDGQYRWFLSRAIPIKDENGKVIRWFGTNTDITEQRQLEQLKDEFLGIASHELKTPVTSIKGYTQLLERRFRNAGDERSAALLQKMNAQLQKLMLLIEDLLDVTRIESGKLLFRYSSFDYNELIDEIVEETQRTTAKHTIIKGLSSTVTLSADRDRIGQVLSNLLTNAIKYSPQADTIIVKTVQTDDAIVTSVQDFGIGIAAEKQQHIFERFYRVEGETLATYPGLGLGLYVSSEFVKRHHGSIRVESEEGKGTTFSFSLPLKEASEGVSK